MHVRTYLLFVLERQRSSEERRDFWSKEIGATRAPQVWRLEAVTRLKMMQALRDNDIFYREAAFRGRCKTSVRNDPVSERQRASKAWKLSSLSFSLPSSLRSSTAIFHENDFARYRSANSFYEKRRGRRRRKKEQDAVAQHFSTVTNSSRWLSGRWDRGAAQFRIILSTDVIILDTRYRTLHLLCACVRTYASQRGSASGTRRCARPPRVVPRGPL